MRRPGFNPFTDLLQAIVSRLAKADGSQVLDIGTINDGEFLKRSSSSIVGAAAGGSTDATTTWAFSGDISVTLSADQNDWNPTGLSTASVIRVSVSGANRTVTGLQGGADGRVIWLMNVSAAFGNDLILANDSASSSAANRFIFDQGSNNVRIRPNCGLPLIYDSTISRWRTLIGSPGNERWVMPDGQSSRPTYAFSSSPNTGIYLNSTSISFAVTGTDIGAFNSASLVLKRGMSFGFGGGLTAGANEAGFRSPTQAQIAVVRDDTNTNAATIYSPTSTMDGTGGAPLPNLKQGTVHRRIITQNVTVGAPTNMVDGIEFTVILVQDSTGSRTASWNAVYKWAGGSAPTLSTGANAVDIFRFWTNGTNAYEISRALDVK